ncbi:protein phosphatase 2C domain-containing protein [Streptomyces sp. NPDC127100]|uniref:protein phosphatase 2C domain-containing protein n=1 Tax=Streptomyces sp. NPDC127100 TaxID=3347138 RepID=UPI00364D9FA0
MSQQGGRPTGPEDDWWGQLYDDSTGDTGPTAAPDSLDDRYASAAGTVGRPEGDPGGEPPADDRPPWWAAPERRDVPEPRGHRGQRSVPGPRTGAAAGATGADGAATDSRPGGGLSAAGPPRDLPDPEVPPPPPPDAASALPPPPPQFLPSLPPRARPPRDDANRVPRAASDAPAPAPGHVGSGPPTYEAEPAALPPADPDALDGLVADTVLEGARYGACTLRAVSTRGDAARHRGDPRRDALLVARFGAGEQALVLVAMATGARATAGTHRAAAQVCRWIGRAVGRSHARLAEDLHAARRGDLKSGLHRLTDRSLGRLRGEAAEQGLAPHEYAASLRCLLLPAAPGCRTRVFFGVGAGGLFRLRDGVWQDLEPRSGEVTGDPVVGFGSPPSQTPHGDRLTMDLGVTAPAGPHATGPGEPSREPFRFRASVARPGDVLLMCSTGLAEPLRGERELGELLARRWADAEPPGLAAFLADSGAGVEGYADDRTAAAVWEA